VNPYQPFIDDPQHLRELDRQRFVVLRVPSPVNETYRQVQESVRQRLTAMPVSYPARPHVTLAGFAAGTDLNAVQEVVRSWARSVPPLSVEVERLTSFPPPFRIAIVQVRKSTELFAALASLWRRAEACGLVLSTLVPPDQWIFHMSVAYCSGVSAATWSELTQFLESVRVSSTQSVVGDAEVVAFDDGREYSGGAFSLDVAQATRLGG
jgi:2'-5' RNA ligase